MKKTKSMTVLLINATYGSGSTGKNCEDILNELKKQECVGYIGFSHGDKPECGYRIGTFLGKKMHAFCSRLFGLQGYFSGWDTIRFLKYVNKINPDIIHINNVHSNYINMNLLYKYIRKNSIPIVLNLHDCWFYTGKCCHYTAVGCSKWQKGCFDCPKLKDENRSWFFDRTSKMWKDKKKNYEQIMNLYVVGVSNWITEEAKKSILKNAQQFSTIYNWVDMEMIPDLQQSYCKQEMKLENKFVILGVASIWDESKGISKFFELAETLDDSFRIVLVGQYNQSLKYPSNMIMVSHIESAEMLMRFYIMADVFITMSLEESFGKVSAEALACGTPVICFDSTANAELVGEGCGYVVEKGNMEKIRNAIVEIQRNGKGHYSNDCKRFAQENFNKEKNVEKYIDLYREMINAKCGGREDER